MKSPTLVSERFNLRPVIYYRDLILVLLAKEFKVRYKSTFLGYAWSLLHPLALALIFLTFFSQVIRMDRAELPGYALYLISGLFPWQWIGNTVSSANGYFLGNSSLIKKVRFNRSTLVLAAVSNESVHFVCSLPVIIGFMLYFGKFPQWSWLWSVPTLLSLQLAMMFGLGLAIATCNLFFRDLERLASLAVQMLFYLTPIVYPRDTLPADYQWVFYANPFASLILCWQGVFYSGQVPVDCLLVAALWSAAWLSVGWFIYSRNVGGFAEIV